MTQGSAQKVTFADRYQSVLVPVIFEPWARELIGRTRPQAGENILDVACGTGVVTRELARTGLEFGELTAFDHSAEMLDVAKELGSQIGLSAQWVKADAGALPFKTDQFDLALCQQALQFFPDRPAALSELHRVLKKGGRTAFSVQREISINPMLRAQAEALERNVGPDAGQAVRAICSLFDQNEIRRMFEAAGFCDVEIETVSLTLRHSDGRAFAAGAMGGMHTGDKLSGLGKGGIESAIDDFLSGLGDYFDGTAINFPHVSNVISASA